MTAARTNWRKIAPVLINNPDGEHYTAGLAHEVGIAPTTAKMVIDRWQELGWLLMEKDRRVYRPYAGRPRNLITLTEEGRKILSRDFMSTESSAEEST